MTATLFYFRDSRPVGECMAAALGVHASEVRVHRFPDGESLVAVDTSAPTAILCRSLNHPNAKLIELLLAADAVRGAGALKVILVAPYLPYQRQDQAFAEGEGVGQRVVGRMIALNFDGLVTVDPHLHRTRTIEAAVPGIPAVAVTATSLFASALEGRPDLVVAAPDEESKQWAEPLANRLGCALIVGIKHRHGDRQVHVSFENVRVVSGRDVILVDDILSTGTTMLRAVQELQAAGARSIELYASHCLAGETGLARLRSAGVASICSTDSVPNPIARFSTGALLADAVDTLIEPKSRGGQR